MGRTFISDWRIMFKKKLNWCDIDLIISFDKRVGREPFFRNTCDVVFVGTCIDGHISANKKYCQSFFFSNCSASLHSSVRTNFNVSLRLLYRAQIVCCLYRSGNQFCERYFNMCSSFDTLHPLVVPFLSFLEQKIDKD